MDNIDDTNVVSSSSSPSTSKANSKEDNGETLCPRGTPVSLQGKLLLETDNALVLNVDWRGKNFSGTLIKVDDSNSWGPQNLQRQPPPQKLEKTWKHFNTPGYKKNRAPRQKGTYSVKYPRSFVDSSNIVESKLRYGRDKRVPAYSSCPSSPKSSDPKSEAASSSGRKFLLSTRRSSSFSFENSSECDDSQPSCSNFKTIQRRHIKSKSALIGKETQCNEVGSSKSNKETIDEDKFKAMEDGEETGAKMLTLSRSGLKEQSANKTDDRVQSFKLRKQIDTVMPCLVSSNTTADSENCMKVSDSKEMIKESTFSASTSFIQDSGSLGVETCSTNQFAATHTKNRDTVGVKTQQRSAHQFSVSYSKNQHSNLTKVDSQKRSADRSAANPLKNQDPDRKAEIQQHSTYQFANSAYQSAATHSKNRDPNWLEAETQQRSMDQFAATCSKNQRPKWLEAETQQRSADQIAATHPKKRHFQFFEGVSEALNKTPSSESDSEKTYANLENCDFNYMNLSGSIDNQKVLSSGEDIISSFKVNVGDTQNEACVAGSANTMQYQNNLEPSMNFSGAVYEPMNMDIQSNLTIQNMLLMFPDDDLVQDANNNDKGCS